MDDNNIVLQNQNQFDRICEKMKKLIIKRQKLSLNQPCQIIQRLLLANYTYAINKKYISDNKITMIISCVKIDEKDRTPGVKYNQILVNDKPQQKISDNFNYFVQLVKQCINTSMGIDGQYGRCMVNCFSGKSRSVAFILSYLIKQKNMPCLQAFNYVKLKYPYMQPNKGFVKQLQQYAIQLRKTNQHKIHNRVIQSQNLIEYQDNTITVSQNNNNQQNTKNLTINLLQDEPKIDKQQTNKQQNKNQYDNKQVQIIQNINQKRSQNTIQNVQNVKQQKQIITTQIDIKNQNIQDNKYNYKKIETEVLSPQSSQNTSQPIQDLNKSNSGSADKLYSLHIQVNNQSIQQQLKQTQIQTQVENKLQEQQFQNIQKQPQEKSVLQSEPIQEQLSIPTEAVRYQKQQQVLQNQQKSKTEEQKQQKIAQKSSIQNPTEQQQQQVKKQQTAQQENDEQKNQEQHNQGKNPTQINQEGQPRKKKKRNKKKK